MKLITAALLAASAAAFAPAQVAQTSTSLSALVPSDGKFENELGVQPPIGFYDPLGLLDNADQERFDRLRYVEVKHGRVCMLAFLGQIVTRAGIHLPGSIDQAGDSFASFPNGIAAILGPDAMPLGGTWQIVGLCGFLELGIMMDSANGAEPGEFPGDFRNGSLDFGWDKFSEDQKLFKRGIELNNGRAAMLGILGLMIHEKLNEIGMVADLPIIGALK